MTLRRLLPVLTLGAWLVPQPEVASQEQTRPAPGVFSADTGVVVLDVVVRDKKGRAVRDLQGSEVDIYEDGVKQSLTGFRLVEVAPRVPVPDSPSSAAAGEPTKATESSSPLNLFTLLFDQLGAAGQALARQAALEFLELPPRPGQYISVFSVGNRLELVQQFTSDRALLKKAVETATGTQGPAMSDDTERGARLSKEEQDIMTGLEIMSTATQGPGAAQTTQQAAAGQEAVMLRMAMDAIRFTDSLQRQQQGEASLFALIGLARQQQRLAGRKTLVYFSEGLRTTSALEQTFRSAISEANRANVSVYAVDARGLTTGSGYNAGRDMAQKAVESVRRQMSSRGTAAVTREEAMAGETVEESLRANTQDTLGDLAQGTGGFLIANTNNLKAGLARMADDVTGYYEVVYSPRKVTFDGAFRKVEVKVGRAGLSVQARSGYFALPPGEGSVTFPYELPLLAALKTDPPPQDFSYRSAAFAFDQDAHGSVYSLGMEVPLEQITFKKEGDGFHGHFRIMAVLRSPTRGIVEKVVQDSPLEVPSARYEALRRGNVFFTRTFHLDPGRYTLETVVTDEQSRKTSVRKAALNVPKDRALLGLSSVTVIKKTEPVAAGALEGVDPFRFGGTRIVPYVGEPTLVKGDDVSLYFVVFPEAAASAPPELLLEFLQEGTVVARSTPALPTADDKGRIPFIVPVPSTRFAPGRIEVRAVVKQGSRSTEGRAFFAISG